MEAELSDQSIGTSIDTWDSVAFLRGDARTLLSTTLCRMCTANYHQLQILLSDPTVYLSWTMHPSQYPEAMLR